MLIRCCIDSILLNRYYVRKVLIMQFSESIGYVMVIFMCDRLRIYIIIEMMQYDSLLMMGYCVVSLMLIGRMLLVENVKWLMLLMFVLSSN